MQRPLNKLIITHYNEATGDKRLLKNNYVIVMITIYKLFYSCRPITLSTASTTLLLHSYLNLKTKHLLFIGCWQEICQIITQIFTGQP